MQTIKTATVVVLLLAVLYGVYVVLNKPSWPPNHPLSWNTGDSSWDDDNDTVRIDVGTGANSDEPSKSFAAADKSFPSMDKSRYRSTETTSEGLPKIEIDSRSAGSGASASATRPRSRPLRKSISDFDATGSEPGTVANGDLSSAATAVGAEPNDVESSNSSRSGISPPSFLADDDHKNGSTGPIDPPDATSFRNALRNKPGPEPPALSENRLRSPAADLAPPNTPDENGDSVAANDPSADPSMTPVDAGSEPTPDEDVAGTANGETDSVSTVAAETADDATKLQLTDSPNTKSLKPFTRVVTSAKSKLEAGQYYEALLALSMLYDNADLTSDENQQLMDLLDPLAGKVIYSTEHLLQPPHEMRVGETLHDVAEKYHVPVELLQNINDISNPNAVRPGTKIKVVPGPFRAEINLERKELTLFILRLYAGRFPLVIGGDAAISAGEFQIQEKSPGRIFVASDGTSIPASDPRNPYGDVWLGLGENLSIHGLPANTKENSAVSIGLDAADARDVFSILSSGSRVLIR